MEGGIEGPLEALQNWFAAVVMHPRSAADGVAAAAEQQASLGADRLEALVTPSDRLSAVARLEIYQYAYHARLIECLADDFATVKSAVGDATWETLARKYIRAHPSQNPNLNYYSRSFPAFVRAQTDLDNYVFLSELAQLEWAMVEVLHAPEVPTLGLAGLKETPPHDWPGIRLRPSPALRFLEFAFPVNAFLQATREGERPPIPARAWSATAIYRPEFKVWRMTFTEPMAQVLRALLSGATLGEALDPLDVTDQTEGNVMVWFQEWVAGGFFSEVDLSHSRLTH